jgi:xanthine dehydrogenase YagS FAD-binding subunit
VCYSVTGENKYHAIFGGGPSYIVHPSDTAPAIIALGAKAKILRAKGNRTVEVEKFFTLPKVDVKKENDLAPGEILAEIHIPSPAPNTRSTYLKVAERQVWDHAIVSIAAAVTLTDGACQAARIVLGGVAPIPWRVPGAEAVLIGKHLDEKLASEAGDAAVANAVPLEHNHYKISLARNLVKRALLALA